MSDETSVVQVPRGWSWFGPRPQRPRGNMPGVVVALFFALPVMTSVEPKYPAYMIVLAIGAAAWFTVLAVKARALIGMFLLPVSLLWLNPLFGAEWFTHEGPLFFLPHAALAMLIGTAAYTYTATEKR